MNETERKQYIEYLEALASSLERKANDEEVLMVATVCIAKANGVRLALAALEAGLYK